MKAYGIRAQDIFKYPDNKSFIRMSSEKVKLRKRPAKKHARQEGKTIIKKGLDDNG